MVTPMITQMQVRNSAKAKQEQEKKQQKNIIFFECLYFFCLQFFFVATGLSLDTRQRKKETKYTLYSSFIFVGTV